VVQTVAVDPQNAVRDRLNRHRRRRCPRRHGERPRVVAPTVNSSSGRLGWSRTHHSIPTTSRDTPAEFKLVDHRLIEQACNKDIGVLYALQPTDKEAPLDFPLSDEQNVLKHSVNAYFSDRYSMSVRREIVASDRGWNIETWRMAADQLGLLGASFPEELGGSGGGSVENMIIMDAIGEHLIIEPYLQTIVIGGRLIALSEHGSRAELIRGIIAGEVTAALAYSEVNARDCVSNIRVRAQRRDGHFQINGIKVMVYAAPWATHLIVAARTSGTDRDEAGISLFLLERNRPGIHEHAYRTVDGFRSADIDFIDVQVTFADLLGGLGGGYELLDQVLDAAAAALCAEAVGCLRRMLAQTLEYARQRKQFGVPLSSFQVLQHRMVDMHLLLEHSTSFAHAAALAAGKAREERRWMISAAKAYIGKACNTIGRDAVQIHGAIGMMDESPVAQYFKRTTVIQGQYGCTSHHLARFSALAGVTLPW
jgi:alkylation response protein AidB-like acyl-CoA dehydrogenase